MLLGPNTNAPQTLLSSTCLLCCGEDRRTFLAALRHAGIPVKKSFAYRCYEFWKASPNLTFITSAIGTGCLEPLLWEILRPNKIRRIILVGTAGAMGQSRVKPTHSYVVTKAWLAGTPLDVDVPQPLKPRWPNLRRWPAASSVSTDFFYGFSPLIAAGKYPLAGKRLLAHFKKHLALKTELVEMEVAQFYAFCQAFGRKNLQYAAVKGVSNILGDEGNQVPNSLAAIVRTLKIAQEMLNAR